MSDFETLSRLVNLQVVEPFIRQIRFPRFKNLAKMATLEFEYPITALIGPNGTNKSSILRALQGCPNLYDIGDYWFDTPLDPIGGSGATDPHRYIHRYRLPSGASAEVIKARVGKTSRGLDYFETSAPRRRDKMSAMPKSGDPRDDKYRKKTRWRPIEKNVVYLDFRQELPAYDILFHFNWRGRRNDVESKKKQIRRGGPHVATALRDLETTHTLYKANRILEAAEKLSSYELESVGRILARSYDSIRLVKHDLFGVEGYTASLRSDERSYSEAYAGSGEFAAIMLVRAIARAPERSLILLDEPETSLHPGAQQELMRFIARECVAKKHQVVFATHSPAMVESLPDNGRKLLDLDNVSRRVRIVKQRASLGEAFSRLGASFAPNTVLVEDHLAKAIVERAARTRGSEFLGSFEVSVFPGGAGTIASRAIPVQAQSGGVCAALLDGDQRPAVTVLEEPSVRDVDLEAELKKIGVSTRDLIRDGGSGDERAQLTSARRKTLAWANAHVDYLPGSGNPEQLLLDMLGVECQSSEGAKSYWVKRARRELSLLENEAIAAHQILDTQVRALAQIEPSARGLADILDTLDALFSSSVR